MKVSAINNNKTNYHIPMQRRQSAPIAAVTHPKNTTMANNHRNKLAGAAAAILASFIGLFYMIKGGKTTEFTRTLASAMQETAGQKVKAKSLSPVMSGGELLKELPKLEKKNYIYDSVNAENGVFRADLHSHSTYSDGDGLVKNILDDAADYADELYKKTKKKFIFALTDHDTAEGLKEALEIISSNPKRFKHLQFVPGMEVSFAHSSPKSANPCEMSEVLVYGINPYSENVKNFVDNIRQKRINMINNFIGESAKKFPLTKFSFEEFSKYYEFEKYGNLMNIHWRAYHYVQTKQAVAVYAGRVNDNPEAMYAKIMENNKGASLGNLRDKGAIPADIQEDGSLMNVLQKYAPHFENGKLIAASENTFEDVITAFKDEPDIFMAFAHPCYYAQHVDNPAEGLKYFTEHSNGLIKASESFHQAYKNDVNEKQISEIQNATEKLNLLNLGGRDSHKRNLFQ